MDNKICCFSHQVLFGVYPVIVALNRKKTHMITHIFHVWWDMQYSSKFKFPSLAAVYRETIHPPQLR